MIQMDESRFRLLYSAEQVTEASKRIGEEVTPWAKKVYEETGKDIIGIPILRGGLFFFADVVRNVRHSVELAPVRTWAYEVGVNAVERAELQIQTDGLQPKGRSLLLFDDVCDSGRTLLELTEKLKASGAAEVRSAVLLKRKQKKDIFDPDWIGFEYSGDEWFVGCGMDDKDRFRNSPAVHTIIKGS